MNKIYIGNLPFQTTEQDLDGMFQQFGKIKEIALIRDRDSREFKGFAFITFVDAESAEKALTLNGNDFQGRAMKVNMAKAETGGGRSGGGQRREGGGYGGGGGRGGFGGGGYGGGRSSGNGGGRGRR